MRTYTLTTHLCIFLGVGPKNYCIEAHAHVWVGLSIVSYFISLEPL